MMQGPGPINVWIPTFNACVNNSDFLLDLDGDAGTQSVCGIINVFCNGHIRVR
jgi:hypothetical protein